MRCYLYDQTGEKLIKRIEKAPVCGEDFCDQCGDCLHCYGSTECMENEEHKWVKYQNEDGTWDGIEEPTK